MLKNFRISFKKYLLGGIFLAFMMIGMPSTALADEAPVTPAQTDNNAVTADNGSNQNANSGTTDPNAAPAADTTTPATDSPPPASDNSNTPQTDQSQQPATDIDATPQQPSACTPSASGDSQQSPQNSGSNNNNGDSNLNENNNSTVGNNLCSQATSGDAAVTDNTTGGDANSGDAQAVANILNVINSVTGLSGDQLKTFVLNYPGQFGDITISPELLDFVLSGHCGCGTNFDVNSTSNSNINNDIYLGANSGSASVSNNGLGGNANSGDAVATLNLINIINSMITTGQSFVGIINIYGDLDGDILLPPDLLQMLLAGGGGGGGGPPGSTNLDITNNQSINNNIDLSAQSGNASVSDNGQGGNATSGNASTSLKVFNLTGSQIIGKNALLVLVNVMGNWIGLIIGQPEGATSALLGGGTSTCGCAGNLDANINNNSQINNNIVLAAQSGDATVSGNGVGGNATSGNASANANIINIINSQLSFADWFGILIINIFGNWNGSFGVDTAAGEPPVQNDSGTGTTSGQGAGAAPVTFAVAHTSGGLGGGGYGGGSDDQQSTQPGGVLGLNTGGGGPSAPEGSGIMNNLWLAGAGTLCCFLMFGLLERRAHKKEQAFEPVKLPKIVWPA